MKSNRIRINWRAIGLVKASNRVRQTSNKTNRNTDIGNKDSDSPSMRLEPHNKVVDPPNKLSGLIKMDTDRANKSTARPHKPIPLVNRVIFKPTKP